MPLCALVMATLAVPLVRDVRPGTERNYRVTVSSEGGDEYAYRLRLRMVGKKKAPEARAEMEFRLTDYRSRMQGQKIALKFVGGGQAPLDPTGLPIGIELGGPQGPVSLPLLALVFPGGEEGPFDLAPFDLGSGMKLRGKGTFSRKDHKDAIDLDAAIVRAGKELGKLTISTALDDGGWPAKSEGTLVSADGTYRFKLQRA